jgi:hypothetical protein
MVAFQGFEPRYAAPEAAVLTVEREGNNILIYKPHWPWKVPFTSTNIFIIRAFFVWVKPAWLDNLSI